MRHYSVQPRDRIIVKDYGFLSFAKKHGEGYWSKCNNKYSIHLLIMLNNLLHMKLKLLQKEPFKKQQKQLVI